MNNHKLGRVLSGTFQVGDPANDFKLVDADSLPTGAVLKNLVADGLTVTAANISTGKYSWTCAPSTGAGFAAGDNVSVIISATVGGNAYAVTVKEVTIQTYDNDDIRSLVNDVKEVTTKLDSMVKVIP